MLTFVVHKTVEALRKTEMTLWEALHYHGVLNFCVHINFMKNFPLIFTYVLTSGFDKSATAQLHRERDGAREFYIATF